QLWRHRILSKFTARHCFTHSPFSTSYSTRNIFCDYDSASFPAPRRVVTPHTSLKETAMAARSGGRVSRRVEHKSFGPSFQDYGVALVTRDDSIKLLQFVGVRHRHAQFFHL